MLLLPGRAEAVLTKRVTSSLKYEEFVRVTLGTVGDTLYAIPLPRGAGVITSVTKAGGILRVPQNAEGYEAGDKVPVRLLRGREEIAKLRAQQARLARRAFETNGSALCPPALFDVINRCKDDDVAVVTDVGQHQMWTAQYVALQKPRKFITSGGLGTMGFGLGAAIGASIGAGCRTILVTGDGSFAMNLNELVTAVGNCIPVTIVLLNNGALGMVRQMQAFGFGRRYSNTELDRTLRWRRPSAHRPRA